MLKLDKAEKMSLPAKIEYPPIRGGNPIVKTNLDYFEERRKQIKADIASGRTKVIPNMAMLRLKQATTRTLAVMPEYVEFQKFKKQ